jgi:transcriptional regulator with XRE-family HTH domain
MATRTSPTHEARRLATWLLSDIARELRLARTTSGMRQADVARALGTSKSRICRVEHARVAGLSIRAVAMHGAAVGLKLSVRLYPLGRRLLDRPQLELLARFRTRIHETWTWETEVPMPIARDLRSTDCRITVDGCSIAVEAITRLADFQAQTRAATLKKRDVAADRLILLVAATHANRRALAEASGVIGASFSMGSRAVFRALADGHDPGADAILLL